MSDHYAPKLSTVFWSNNQSTLREYFASYHSFATWIGQHHNITFNWKEPTLQKIIQERIIQIQDMKKRIEKRNSKKKDWLIQ